MGRPGNPYHRGRCGLVCQPLLTGDVFACPLHDAAENGSGAVETANRNRRRMG